MGQRAFFARGVEFSLPSPRIGCLRLLYGVSTPSLCTDCLNDEDRASQVAEFRSDRFGERRNYVGYRLCRCEHVVFCHRDWIRDGMRPARREGDAEMMELLALGLVTVALLIYLVYALLRPEKF